MDPIGISMIVISIITLVINIFQSCHMKMCNLTCSDCFKLDLEAED